MELSVNASRVEGPNLADILPGWEQIVDRKELCRGEFI
ncbi:hypothetical protein HMPREF9137_0875 [Prevotella denticola F0289]|nr:hypothetical protein HMPREF9137_0875 [Prevotella denticola F0289]